MTLIAQLKQIPDVRHIRGRRHPLWMILWLSLLGFLCGYDGYRPLADFCAQSQVSLRALLGLPETQAMPSYSTFRRSFVSVEPQGWVECFNAWAQATLPLSVAGLFSIDGKSIRCTSTGGKTSAQNFVMLVSVYEQRVGVVRLAMMQNQKASEIHVAQALIAQLHYLPSGQCFSLDALHTTQATVNTITATGQHYLVAVKQNRADTYRAIELLTQTEGAQSEAMQVDNTHSRYVTRRAQVFAPTAQLQAKWRNLVAIGVVQRSGTRQHKPFTETVYYLSSAHTTAAQLLAASRQHWQIENGLHWVKDVTFKEDYPEQRGGHAPVTWAILNTFCITLARRQGWRTVPQALRAWANQLDQVFHFLV
jgi:predicted transposase YbfD/YdcC